MRKFKLGVAVASLTAIALITATTADARGGGGHGGATPASAVQATARTVAPARGRAAYTIAAAAGLEARAPENLSPPKRIARLPLTTKTTTTRAHPPEKRAIPAPPRMVTQTARATITIGITIIRASSRFLFLSAPLRWATIIARASARTIPPRGVAAIAGTTGASSKIKPTTARAMARMSPPSALLAAIRRVLPGPWQALLPPAAWSL